MTEGMPITVLRLRPERQADKHPYMMHNNQPETIDEHGREVTDVRVGRAYVSSNGRLVIDQHASDVEHLVAQATRTTQPLYDCRVYFDEVIPKEWVGKPGKFTVRRTRSLCGEVLEVSIAFERD